MIYPNFLRRKSSIQQKIDKARHELIETINLFYESETEGPREVFSLPDPFPTFISVPMATTNGAVLEITHFKATGLIKDKLVDVDGATISTSELSTDELKRLLFNIK